MPKGIGEAIKAELESLGIKLTSTLASNIPNSTEEIVLTAIEALKEELQHQVIKTPGGWMAQLITAYNRPMAAKSSP
ncbi:hypothetical protein [Trichormus azollae]|uniref:hypothetical protein n=1 Tax=Trichormus azollae TaxID=1164 RepID=UPI00325EF8E6